MLIIIAWRNIWRNKLRSIVIMLSIAIGLWAGVFVLGFAWGLYKGNLRDVIHKQLSHFQIHHPAFLAQTESVYRISNTDSVLVVLKTDDRVQSVSSRAITTGMISSPTTASGVKINGIIPSDESKQIELDKNVIEGDYFRSEKSNEILIGEKLALKLKVKLKSKVVLTFTGMDNDITSAAFRICGIYKTKNSALDEMMVYVKQPFLQELLGFDKNETNEIAVLLKDENDLVSVKNNVHAEFKNLATKDWRQLSPELDLLVGSFNLYTYIIIGIILLALTFGIINTMLMAVLERVREIGMLMAIGLNKSKLFIMIMLETVFLTLIGCPLGLLMAKLTIGYLGKYGIDLSAFSEGLASYGFSAIIYPEIDNSQYVITSVMTLTAAILSSVYPAIKALQLNPSQAIRKI